MQYTLLVVLSVALLTGCVSSSYHINLMPVPALYANSAVDPFRNGDPFVTVPYHGVLYATDREPKQIPDGSHFQRYESSSGFALRLGRAEVEMGNSTLVWQDVKEASLKVERSRNYSMRMTRSEEFGILQESIAPLVAGAFSGSSDPKAAFVEQVADGFSRSSTKQIHIFVPGARSPFDSAILVGGEMWHYLGYDGVMIAYAWPAQPKGIGLSYFGDAEATTSSSRNLRLLLEFLVRQTEVERINLVTYSAGGRIVLNALSQMAMMGVTVESSKIGNVILTGSDVAETTFGGYVADGLLSVIDRLTVYASAKDLTLGVAEFVYGRRRIGQMRKDGRVDPLIQDYLLGSDDFDIVNVTSASTNKVPWGHSYFRSSSEISSDILVTLLYNMSPAERGLVRTPDNPVWSVPSDYENRVREAVLARDL